MDLLCGSCVLSRVFPKLLNPKNVGLTPLSVIGWRAGSISATRCLLSLSADCVFGLSHSLPSLFMLRVEAKMEVCCLGVKSCQAGITSVEVSLFSAEEQTVFFRAGCALRRVLDTWVFKGKKHWQFCCPSDTRYDRPTSTFARATCLSPSCHPAHFLIQVLELSLIRSSWRAFFFARLIEQGAPTSPAVGSTAAAFPAPRGYVANGWRWA